MITEDQIQAAATKIFALIDREIRDRSGIKHEWALIDDKVMFADIKPAWEKIFAREIRRLLNNNPRSTTDILEDFARHLDSAAVDIYSQSAGTVSFAVSSTLLQVAKALNLSLKQNQLSKNKSTCHSTPNPAPDKIGDDSVSLQAQR